MAPGHRGLLPGGTVPSIVSNLLTTPLSGFYDPRVFGRCRTPQPSNWVPRTFPNWVAPAATARGGALDQDPERPVYVISVAAGIVSVHPRTLRIYEDEGLIAPARTPTNIRLYSENDIRRVLWIRHLTQERGVNLAGIRILFELEERLGTRILEALFDEGVRARERAEEIAEAESPPDGRTTDASRDRVQSSWFSAGTIRSGHNQIVWLVQPPRTTEIMMASNAKSAGRPPRRQPTKNKPDARQWGAHFSSRGPAARGAP